MLFVKLVLETCPGMTSHAHTHTLALLALLALSPRRLNCTQYLDAGMCKSPLLEGYCCQTCQECFPQCMIDAQKRVSATTTTTTLALDENGIPYYPIVLERASDVLGCVTTKSKYYRW
jgi:hypothetical protein